MKDLDDLLNDLLNINSGVILVCAGLAGAVAFPHEARAQTSLSAAPVFPQVVHAANNQVTTLGTFVPGIVGAANNSICNGVTVTSTDSVAHTIQLVETNGTISNIINALTLAAGAGTNGTTPPLTNLLTGPPFDSSGNPVHEIMSGWTLGLVNSATAVTGGSIVAGNFQGEDFK
jgi:hypothetical protein